MGSTLVPSSAAKALVELLFFDVDCVAHLRDCIHVSDAKVKLNEEDNYAVCQRLAQDLKIHHSATDRENALKQLCDLKLDDSPRSVAADDLVWHAIMADYGDGKPFAREEPQTDPQTAS
jgi:hypothetical protein